MRTLRYQHESKQDIINIPMRAGASDSAGGCQGRAAPPGSPPAEPKGPARARARTGLLMMSYLDLC